MFIKRVLSYRNAWEKINTNNLAELNSFYSAIDFELSTEVLSSYSYTDEEYIKCYLKIRKNLEGLGWSEDSVYKKLSHFSDRNGYIGGMGHLKNGISIKDYFNEEDTLIWSMKDIQENSYLRKIDIGIQYTLDRVFEKNELSHFNKVRNLLSSFNEVNLVAPFLFIELSVEKNEIEVIEINSKKTKVERSIEFKPEHYQAGLGILSYFGTVMRKKYPEQNAKVKIEQEDDKVRLIVESENGNKEVIERAFHEFGLVIHQDIKPEEFYDNYLDVAELKTKLGILESELKFQHQLVKVHENRAIELEKDKEFLKNVIGQALVRPNSPIYINNQLHNSQSTVINHKVEFTKSNDDLEDLIDLADSEALKNRLATIQNALEVNRNADQPEEVKDSSGMKKLAKFLKEANEVGTEANTLAENGGKALDLIKNLGRRYNSIAEWCGMPNIPTVFVKE